MAIAGRKIESLQRSGMYSDGNIPPLTVALGGSKQWVQRFTITIKRREWR